MPDIGGVISGGASIIGGAIEGKAASDAADTQAQAAAIAAEETRRQYDLTRGDLAPYRDIGAASFRELANRLGLPGYAGGTTTTGAPSANAQREFDLAQAELNRLRARQNPQGAGSVDPRTAADNLARYGIYSYPDAYQRGPLASNNAGQLGQQYWDALRKAEERMKRAEQSLASSRQSVTSGPSANAGSLLAPFQFETEPGYQFRLGEGAKAVENSAAARGMQLSGATLKALQRYNQDFASNEYGNAFGRDFNRRNQIYNFLSGPAQMGQNAAAQTAGFGAQATQNINEANAQGANAIAAGQVGRANALSGTIGDVAGYYRLQNLLRQN